MIKNAFQQAPVEKLHHHHHHHRLSDTIPEMMENRSDETTDYDIGEFRCAIIHRILGLLRLSAGLNDSVHKMNILTTYIYEYARIKSIKICDHPG